MRKISKEKLIAISADRPKNYLRTIKKYTVREDDTHVYMESHHYVRLSIKYRKKYVPLKQRVTLVVLMVIGHLTYWPLSFFKTPAHQGVGDTVEAVIQKATRVKRKCGGCNRRKNLLNAAFPYKRKHEIVKSVSRVKTK